MLVRLTSGLKKDTEIEVDDHVGRAFLVSGKAELVVTEVAEVHETPEKPKVARGRRAKAEPETR